MLRFLRRLVLFLICALAAVAGALYWLTNRPLELPATPTEFSITPGSSLRSAAQQVRDAGIAVEPLLLVGLGRLLGVEAKIKAGSYEVTSGTTPLALLRKLTRGDFSQSEIVFIEGWTLRQMRERLAAHPDVRHDAQGLTDAELMQRLGSTASVGEGQFFPDTYLFAKNGSDLDILARAHRAMQRHLEREWLARQPGLPYATAQEALVMASIVEKESGRAAERPLIAAVFVNRLRAGMPLQTDPTVIYGLGAAFDGNLRKRDLLADTPYNTYTRRGLPPGPIALPGLESLRAALNPAASDALYFVARGDGTSQFSRSLDEHNRAVARYQLKGAAKGAGDKGEKSERGGKR